MYEKKPTKQTNKTNPTKLDNGETLQRFVYKNVPIPSGMLNVCMYVCIDVWLHLCIVCMWGLTIHT